MIESYSNYTLLLEAQQRLKMNVPKDVIDLHKLFKKNKRELYVVGGRSTRCHAWAKNQKTLI